VVGTRCIAWRKSYNGKIPAWFAVLKKTKIHFFFFIIEKSSSTGFLIKNLFDLEREECGREADVRGIT
jgi:hypothetical protein